MAVFEPKFTAEGMNMLRRWVTYEEESIISYVLGSGKTSSDPSAVTQVVTPQMEVEIDVIDGGKESGDIRLEASFFNSQIPRNFVWRELGIYFAKNGVKKYTAYGNGTNTMTVSDKPEEITKALKDDDDQYAMSITAYDSESGEVQFDRTVASTEKIVFYYVYPTKTLLAYAYNATGVSMVKSSGVPEVKQTIAVNVNVKEAGSVSAMVSEKDMYANSSDFENHRGDKSNPHRLNKGSVGLINVENVSPNRMTPGYTEENIVSLPEQTDVLKKIIGKTRIAISTLINHIESNSNPHNVTKEQIGLGNVANSSPGYMIPGFVKYTEPEAIKKTDRLAVIVGKIMAWMKTLNSYAHTHSNANSLNALQDATPNVAKTLMCDPFGRYVNVYAETCYEIGIANDELVGFTKDGEFVYRIGFKCNCTEFPHVSIKMTPPYQHMAKKILRVWGTYHKYNSISDKTLSGIMMMLNTRVDSGNYAAAYFNDSGYLTIEASAVGEAYVYIEFTKTE